MTHPEKHVSSERSGATSVLDDYFAVISAGREYYTAVAWRTWQFLSPRERRDIQKTASETAGSDLVMSEAIAQSYLVIHCITNHVVPD